MRRLPFALLLASLMIPAPARADGGEAIAALIMAGGFTGAAMGAYGGVNLRGLEDWSQPGTEESRILGSACGLSYEAALIQNNAYAFLILALKNHDSAERAVDPERVRLAFDPGPQRLPSQLWRTERLWLKKDMQRVLILPLPSKEDLVKGNALAVSWDVHPQAGGSPCVAEAKFKRSSPADAVEGNSVTSAVIGIGGGLLLSRTGDLKELGPPTGNFVFEFYGYPNPRHGMFLGIYVEGFDGGDRTKLLPATGGGDPVLALTHFTLGYSRRHHFSSRFNATLDLGLGMGLFTYDKATSNERQEEITFSSTQTLNLNYTFARSREGFWRGDYMLGVGLYHGWVFGGELKGIPLGGQTWGALFMLRFGG
ncbi:MAG: hypothetical protein IT285_09230 [Bdellovibrionales bacterium]|nr:hypothetical protein [Bdellovibrionales bacterium]